MYRQISVFFQIILLSIGGTTASAQGTVTPFADLNTGPNSSASGSLREAAVFFDGRTFFVATTRDAGSELWTTDGTALNTQRFGDICPGRCSSTPSGFYVEGSNLFFSADDGRLGRELWRYAVGAGAPALVADINPGAPGSDPALMARKSFRVGASVATRTFFIATRQAEGREFWRLNASVTPTVALELDLVPGAASSSPSSFTGLNTMGLGMIANTPNVGSELYVLNYSSTTAPPTGASVLAGFNTNAQRFVFGSLTSLASNTYLLLFDRTTSSTELWATQGTTISAVKLRTAQAIRNITVNVALTRLFFTSGSSSAQLLAISDGTLAGTSNLSSASVDAQNLVSIGNQLLFTGVTATNGRELFSSDGSTAGTGLLKELVSGVTGIENQVATASANNARMLLGFNDLVWISDGSNAGTVEISGSAIQGTGRVFRILPTTGISALIGFDPQIFFSSSEPFFTQGTIGSTVALGNLIGDVGDSFAAPIAAFNNRLMFNAFIPGQTAGTFSLLANGPSSPEALGNFSETDRVTHFSKLWFRSSSGLIQSDATAAGTSLIPGLQPEIRDPGCVVERNGAAYFIARGLSFFDVELYRSDGSAANTQPVTDFSTDTVRGIDDFCFAGRRPISGFADKILFFASPNGLGTELYALNAADQASLVADIRTGSAGSAFGSDLVALTDRAVFQANDGIFGNELWVSTGTAQGTQRLTDIHPGAEGSDPGGLTRVGNLIYFTAFDPLSGRELYVTNGTVAGTRLVRDLFVGSGSAFADSFSARIFGFFGNKLYFAAQSSTEPLCSVFESDGTLAGTHCAYDSVNIFLGPAQRGVVIDNGAVVFSAARFFPEDGEEIRALFNGQLLNVDGYDIAPGAAGSAPDELLASGNTVFFRADDGVTGSELWRLDVPNLDVLFVSGFE